MLKRQCTAKSKDINSICMISVLLERTVKAPTKKIKSISGWLIDGVNLLYVMQSCEFTIEHLTLMSFYICVSIA